MGGILCFSLSTDDNNHGNIKLFPILIQYFDWKFYNRTQTPNETTKTISSYIIETLLNYNLFSKCWAFSGDNTNINFGGINTKPSTNVFILFKRHMKKDLVAIGCSAHILNNASHHGCDLFSVGIDSITIKIFFNLFSSNRRALRVL